LGTPRGGVDHPEEIAEIPRKPPWNEGRSVVFEPAKTLTSDAADGQATKPKETTSKRLREKMGDEENENGNKAGRVGVEDAEDTDDDEDNDETSSRPWYVCKSEESQARRKKETHQFSRSGPCGRCDARKTLSLRACRS
jgi:hypothetical protein